LNEWVKKSQPEHPQMVDQFGAVKKGSNYKKQKGLTPRLNATFQVELANTALVRHCQKGKICFWFGCLKLPFGSL